MNYKNGKKLLGILSAASILMLSSAPAQGLEYKLKNSDKQIKKMVLTIQEHEDLKTKEKDFKTYVKRIFADDTKIVEGYSEGENGNFLSWMYETFEDGKTIETYLSRGRPHYIIHEENLPDGTIKRHMDQDGDGRTDFYQFIKSLDENKTLTITCFDDKNWEKIKGGDLAVKEKIPNGIKETGYSLIGDGTQEIWYVFTTETIEDVTITKKDYDADGQIDKIITERIVDGSRVIKYDNDADGQPDEVETSKRIELILNE